MIYKIPLTKGKEAVVSKKDYEYLSQWKWHCCNGYAARRDCDIRQIIYA